MMASRTSEGTTDVVAGLVRELAEVLVRFGDEQGSLIAKAASERLVDPHSYVIIVGETSTGKSSLINGALGASILPTAASPTTATVTLVALTSRKQPQFVAVRRDGHREEIDRDRFLEMGRRPPESLLRLEVEAKPVEEKHIVTYVIDTPGYNSLIVEHEEVLQAFLPESDVVVLVTGYRTGFGQVDQDLLEVVSKALRDAELIPMILVVNRTPPGASVEDERIQEMFRNAKDSLQRTPELVLIESVLPKSEADGENKSQQTVLPQTAQLWDLVHERAASPEQLRVVRSRLLSLIENLRGNAEADVRRRLELLEATPDEEEEIKSEIAALREAESKSLTAVSNTFKRLSSTLPLSLRRHCDSLLKDLDRDIGDTDKWLDQDGCVAWIRHHAMPFGIKRIARAIEEQMVEELERLDRELEEIANSAIEAIKDRARLRSAAAARLATHLAFRLGQRLGGAAMTSLFRSFGGACGPAAGAGNLAKMAVKRLAGLFGKRLGRDVYNQIGRAFTKRALQRLAAVFAVVIEAGMYLWDAATWQGKFKKSVREAMKEWQAETANSLLNEQLPDYQRQNEEAVHEWYDTEIRILEDSLSKRTGDCEAERARLQPILDDLIRIGQSLAATEKI